MISLVRELYVHTRSVSSIIWVGCCSLALDSGGRLLSRLVTKQGIFCSLQSTFKRLHVCEQFQSSLSIDKYRYVCVEVNFENILISLTKYISFPRLEGPYIEAPLSTAGPSQQQVLDSWQESPLLVCKPLQGHLLERSSPLMPNVMTSDVTYLGTFRGDDIMAKA